MPMQNTDGMTNIENPISTNTCFRLTKITMNISTKNVGCKS